MIDQRHMDMIALGDPNLRPRHRSVVSPQLGLASEQPESKEAKSPANTVSVVCAAGGIGPMDPAEPMLMLSGDGLPFFPERMTKPAVTTMQMTTNTNTTAILTAFLMLPPLGLRIL